MKLSALLLCATTAALPLAAQTAEGDSVIHRNITIEREYHPVIQDAGKINTLPHFIEPKVTKTAPQYTTDFSRPLHVDHNIHYLSAAGLAYQRPANKEGFARVGIGTGFNSLADFAYPLLKKPDMKLDFRLNHYGLFNRKAHSNTQATLAFDKQFNAFNFFAGVSGGHEYYKYYGTIDSVNTDLVATPVSLIPMDIREVSSLSHLRNSNHLWRGNAHAGLSSSQSQKALRYGVTLHYDLFNSREGVTEQGIRLNGNIDGLVGGNRLGMDIRSQNIFYATDPKFNTPNNVYILALNPYYTFEKQAFDLRLGFNFDFSFGNRPDFSNSTRFRPSPDVRFEWRAMPRFLSLYAGVGGEYRIHTLSELYGNNPYLTPSCAPQDSYAPIDLYLGMKIKPVSGLLIDAFVDYKYAYKLYEFTNVAWINHSALMRTPPPLYPPVSTTHYLNRFEASSNTVNVLKAGGRVSYTYHDKFSISASGAYYHWSRMIAYKPTWELNVDANVRITKKLHAYAHMDFCGVRMTQVGNEVLRLCPVIDINLGASYDFLDWLSVFLKVNNLINNKYELWHGYEAQGLSVMAGASFDF